MTPLNDELRVIRMTVGREFMAELEEVKAALSHKVPSGSFETLLRECFRITLEAAHVATVAPETVGGVPWSRHRRRQQQPKMASR